MAQAVQSRSITVTAAYEPRARAAEARTKAGTLRRPARQWRDGLAWSTKLQLLDARPRMEPPYEATVHGYFPPQAPEDLPSPQDWFEGIATALGEALEVDPVEIHLRAGRVAYTPPFSPAHLEIVVTPTGDAADDLGVVCPACGNQWSFDADLRDDDRCPHCGHEDGGLPYRLGMV